MDSISFDETGMYLGLLVSAVVLAGATKCSSKVTDVLCAPLGALGKTATGPEDIPALRSVFWLFGVYAGMIFVFGLSGGTIASFPAGSDHPNTERLIKMGIVGGILLTALARVFAVFASTALASSIRHLIVASVAVAGFCLPALFSKHNPISVPELSVADLRYGVFGLICAAWTMALVEGVIYCIHRWGICHAVTTSSGLLRERAEEYEELEQVFLPSQVEPRTNECIRETISREGPIDICWMTTTFPRSHFESLEAATITWLAEKLNTERSDPEVFEKAKRLLAANVKIIVPESSDITHIRKSREFGYDYYKRFRFVGSQFRTRVLILNQTCAITHLPVPYDGLRRRQANFAAIGRTPEAIARAGVLFESVWERAHYRGLQDLLIGTYVSSEKVLPIVLNQVWSHSEGVAVATLRDVLQKSGVPDADVELKEALDTLVRSRAIRVDGQEVRPLRECMLCSVRDSWERIFGTPK